jgi:hypothetical protein
MVTLLGMGFFGMDARSMSECDGNWGPTAVWVSLISLCLLYFGIGENFILLREKMNKIPIRRTFEYISQPEL